MLGFDSFEIYEKISLSQNPVDILFFDYIFLECNVAQRMILKGKCSGIIHNFTMDVDPGYEDTEKFRGGVEWYMVESKDIISSICFKFKKMKTIN